MFLEEWVGQDERIRRAVARAFAEPVAEKLFLASPKTPTYYERKAQEFEEEQELRAWMVSVGAGLDKLAAAADLLIKKLEK